MSVTVSVAASWRLSRVEFNTPHDSHNTITGFGEVLMQESAEPSPDSKILSSPYSGKTYGAMPTAAIQRSLSEVMDDEVEIDGSIVKFSDVMAALPVFFEKWRMEDLELPPLVDPVGAEPTPVPKTPVIEQVDGRDAPT